MIGLKIQLKWEKVKNVLSTVMTEVNNSNKH